MARIFITGAADGLGLLAAKDLIAMGHEVVLHARNDARAAQAMDKLPGATRALTADLANIAETKLLAEKANETGTFDAVMHNAGIYNIPNASTDSNGMSPLLAVNTLAPYILTSLMHQPKRLVYLSSGMHRQGRWRVADTLKGKNYSPTYADTKLQVLLLAFAVARKWSGSYSNAVDPGWVPTKMGGKGAPDSLSQGVESQVWLAVSDEPAARVTGHYFHHKQPSACAPLATNTSVQNELLSFCEKLTGVGFGDGTDS